MQTPTRAARPVLWRTWTNVRSRKLQVESRSGSLIRSVGCARNVTIQCRGLDREADARLLRGGRGRLPVPRHTHRVSHPVWPVISRRRRTPGVLRTLSQRALPASHDRQAYRRNCLLPDYDVRPVIRVRCTATAVLTVSLLPFRRAGLVAPCDSPSPRDADPNL
jgi:hypothetical protein